MILLMKPTALLTLIFLCWIASVSACAEDSYFDSHGVKVHYVTVGSGEPVILIHGWMADATMWGRDAKGNAAPKAPEGFEMIAIDCRGHGKSDKPHDPSQYGPEMAEDVVRLLDHLKIKKAHLLGYSMGAYIAGMVAAKHPDRVLSTIYASQAPLILGPKWTNAREVDVFVDCVEKGKDLGEYYIEITQGGQKKPTLEQANAAAKFMFAGKDLKALAAVGRSFKDMQVKAEDLRQCKAPTLFMYGGNEGDGVKNDVAIARKALGRGDVKVIEGANHMTTLMKPEFGLAIVEFLNSHKSR